MPEAVQAKMESAFDTDFSAVRVHEGPQATAMGALALTQGTDIHFAPGQYDPQSTSGQELLGHELTHVVQQSQGRVTPQAKGSPINADAGLEAEADAAGARAAKGEPVHITGATGLSAGGSDVIQRKVGFEFEVDWAVKATPRNDLEQEQADQEQHAFETEKQNRIAAGRQRTQQRYDTEYEDVKKLFQNTDQYKQFVVDMTKYKTKVSAYEKKVAVKKLLARKPRAPVEPTRGTLPSDDAERTPLLKLLFGDPIPGHVNRAIYDNSSVQTVSKPAKLTASDGDGLSMYDNAFVRSDFIPGLNVPKTSELMGPLAPAPEGVAVDAGPAQVADGALWHLTADQNSGTSQLEWVTVPLTSEGQVTTAMGEIVAMGTRLEQLAATRSPIDAADLEAGGVGAIMPSFKARGLKIYPNAGKKLQAAPQVTGGLRLDQLGGFMSRLASAGKKDDAYKLISKLGDVRSDERDMLDQALAGAQQVTSKTINGKAGSKELVGLLALALNYMFMGQESLDNSKGIAAAFMGRTDFAHNFNIIPEAPYFRTSAATKQEFVDLVAEISGLDMGEKVFAKGFKIRSSDAQTHEYPLTRGDWLRGMVDGTDYLKKSVPSDVIDKPFLNGGEDHVHQSLGRLGSVDDKVGEEQKTAAVVELRRMGVNIPVSEWAPLATYAYQLIESFNTPRRD